jgi:ABC-type transport system involved in multi-copper enzyme maturation permease subunit
MNDVTTRPTGAAGTDPRPLPSLGAILWLAWFSFREMVRRKRLFGLAAINLVPVLVVLAIRIWATDLGISPHLQLAGLTHDVFIEFLIPIAAMAMAIPAIGEQVDDGTIVFTWTRPVRRWAIYLGRLCAAQVVAAVVMSGALVLCFGIMVSEGVQVISFEFLRVYLVTFLIILLGSISYSALFAAMGTFFRKPVLPAILFTFGWESMVTNVPARIQEVSLRFHLQNLVERPPAAPSDLPGVLEAFLSTAFTRDPVPKPQSVAVLLIVTALATLLGAWLLKHKEIEK